MSNATKKSKSATKGGQTLSEVELGILQHYVEVLKGNQIRITKKLDSELYERIKLAVERLGGVYLPNQRRFEFPLDPCPLLRQTVALGQMPKENPLDFFYSPSDVVEALLDELEWGDTMLGLLAAYEQEGRPIRVIEPSAGLGHLADAFRARYPMATIDVCELDPYRRAALESKGYTVVAEDFLRYHPALDCFYDVCLMNPPFTVNGDTSVFLKHIRHAYTMLADHGLSKLVSVVPAQVARQKRYQEFYIQVVQYGDYQDLPNGSFVEAGTTWQTGIVSLSKRLNDFYAHWDGLDPEDNYPNQRLKRAWMYISADSKLVEAYSQLLNSMLEGKLPIYTSGKASTQTKEAMRAFSLQVTEYILSEYKLYIPLTSDETFMEQHILADYRLAQQWYSKSKRERWQVEQQRKSDRLHKRIEEARQRIERSHEHIARQERQLADDARALEELTCRIDQEPDFTPAPPLPDPQEEDAVCDPAIASPPLYREQPLPGTKLAPDPGVVITRAAPKRLKKQGTPYILHSLFDVPGL
ncbi:hypothetical protein KDA_74810 [Dictyobacter alpinus]|uniref:DUF4942 domain-containing protein n=1 Tax=Dictyobacter alpinus TaxID=2014873 RepID=A0A402BKV3_9CHLR|nr:hypothetical protein [Dictyobacter alpinus]GCE31997.1 hypothetical protein KDA_74810 [Dictyobacter alpinus]